MSDTPEPDQIAGAPHPRGVHAYLGHEDAEAQMAAAAAGGRVHHAWLITGPKGLGKATLAYRFARSLLGARTIGPRPFDVDPDDPVSRRVAGLSHGDVFVLRRSLGDRGRVRREITADDARLLPGFFSLAPAEGGWRVAVIDAVDDLNRHAANAILKILEEPPPRCVLLLICHSPGAALATIRSRCRRIALRPLSDTHCADAVRGVLGQDADPRAVTLAKGRPGRAVALQALGAPALAEGIESALRRAPRDGGQALAALAFERSGDAHDRLDLVLDLTLDMLADAISVATRGAGGGPLAGLIDAASAPRWAKAWTDLGELRDQAEGLGQDPTHALLRAGALLSQAGQVRA